MPHIVSYNRELHIIETRTEGEVTLSESEEIIAEIVQTAAENNCFLCLSDYREETMKLSTLEIYDLPKTVADVSASQGIPAYRFKRAIVAKKNAQDFRFFETVTLNSGQNIKLFEDIEEARKWLLEDNAP